MKLNKMREEMAASFLAALKEEKIPWHKEWSAINGRPLNAINGSYYHGANSFWLSYIQDTKGYSDPRWCTYNQAKAQGWQVRKGEKGTKVEFWSLYDTEAKEKITKQQAEELQKQISKEDFYDRVKPISNVYTVFNGEQIKGIPEITVERHLLDEKLLMEKRNILLKNMGVGFQEGKEGASYQSKTDVIGMPDMERFENEYAYLSVMLHEAGHATGHESRLNRKLGNAFGSPEYAKEELRAEIASAFTAQALGIDARDQEHMENHKAYVQSWIQVLEKNPEELFAAIRDAERISDYLIEKGEFEIAEIKQLEKGKESQERQEEVSQKNPEYDSEKRMQIRKGLEERTVANVKSDIMEKIEEFAKEHHVPIYEEMPEGFRINEGAMTAPSGAKWIMDNASILEKKRGLLLDKEMIRLLEPQYSREDVYSRMTESEKESFDLAVDYGDMEGAKKIMEDKRRELSKSIPHNEKEVSILGYYTREDKTQFIHYKVNEKEYLTSGICTWPDKIQERLARLIPMDEKAFDLKQMEKNLRKYAPYGKLGNHVRELLEEENRKMERRKTADQPKEESLLQERSRKCDEKHKIR